MVKGVYDASVYMATVRELHLAGKRPADIA
jgi:hypothetical protein